MRPASRPASLLATAFLLSACIGDPAATPAATGAGPGSPASTATPGSTAAATTAQPSPPASTGGSTEPVPSDQLGPFECELPIVEDASVGIANITDVRIGTHTGYDRVVFEFEQGTPELTLDRATPPFTEDASGAPMDVEGAGFLRLTMRGGTKQTDAGTSSYDGSTDFRTSHPSLVHLVEGGDFERQSTWYLGLTGEACVRVLLLDDPARLVIDLEHP